MSDLGTRFTDARHAALVKQFNRVYRQAQQEIIEKLNEHTKRMNAKAKIKLAQLAAGTLSQQDFDDWLNGQVYVGKLWHDKVTSVTSTLMQANQQANAMIENEKRAVFGENASFQAYQLEHDADLDLSFTVYDSATVTRLLNEEPELLPRKRVNGRKDQAWNRRNIANAVTQGIIQGESVDKVAKRIAKQTCSKNKAAMTRYARTALTGAQNAGRIEVMHEAQDMGIKVKKRWLAALDSRTREAHQHLDSQVQEVDKPFHSDLGDIMYPGDFRAKPGNVWNCRCTLVYEYDEYPTQYSERRAYAEYIDDDGEYHRESYTLGNISYNNWKKIKSRENQKALSAWRAKNGRSAVTAAAIDSSKKTTGWQTEASEALPKQFESDKALFQRAGISQISGVHTYVEDMWRTNPDYDESDPGSSENCQRCVLAYVARRKGFDVEAQKIHDLVNDKLMINYGWKRAFGGDPAFLPIFNITDRNITGEQIRDNIRDLVQKSDNGAIYAVAVDWAGMNAGHAFIVENHNGEAVFVNPQNPAARIDDWWSFIHPRATRLFRVDDKPFTTTILEGVQKSR